MIPEKIAARIDFDSTGCWFWTGSRDGEGYGRVRFDGRTWMVHRLIYTMVKGPIPPGLHIDHLCVVPPCCNPDHLEAVTPFENARRAKWGAGVTQCFYGHEYTPENTAWTSAGKKRCKVCDRARKRAYRKARRDAIGPVPPRTECTRGHQFDQENTYTDADGWRHCRTCKRIADAVRWAS